jgi:hypothetical protein
LSIDVPKYKKAFWTVKGKSENILKK